MSEEQAEYKTNAPIIVSKDDAWERHKRIVSLRNSAEQTFLSLGEELFWFEDKKQYLEMGHPTFESYLADPDVEISRRLAFQLKGVYLTFVWKLKVQTSALLPVGTNKLDALRPYVNNENVNEWIAKAGAISLSDLKIALAEAFPPPPPPPLPAGKYRIIYADPPWKYGDNLVDGYGPAINHYQLMTIPELSALPVKGLAGEDAVLFLWVTSPLLDECFEVIQAWGFEYKTSFIWDKVRHNYGHYNSVRHELLLVCTRGSCPPDVPELFDSVQTIERTEIHSQKPMEFRTIIDTLYPNGKRIELFARELIPGWETWGNELPTI